MLSSRDDYPEQLRLFFEEICCDLLRMEHATGKDGHPPDQIRVLRELALAPGAFADIRIDVPGSPPYYVEVKYGYAADDIRRSLARKYGDRKRVGIPPAKIVVLVEASLVSVEFENVLRQSVDGIPIELWTERTLLEKGAALCGLKAPELSANTLEIARAAIERAKGRFAFGDDIEVTSLTSMLLWHFSYWRLRQLREGGLKPEQILRPGRYANVVVLMADLCGFSSYTRDTHDRAVIRESLTSFYSKARYAVANCGGMFYQFVGDEVIAIFGIPDGVEAAAGRAMACARALVDIGSSVSNEWQRRIDRVQASGGVHLGAAVGDLELVPLRPFSLSHFGLLGDAINLAARLMSVAAPSELVGSNTLYNDLPPAIQASFRQSDEIEAKNVGRIKAWRTALGSSPRA